MKYVNAIKLRLCVFTMQLQTNVCIYSFCSYESLSNTDNPGENSCICIIFEKTHLFRKINIKIPPNVIIFAGKSHCDVVASKI